MPLKPRRIPSYRLHKPSGRARVIIDRRHIYLGNYGSPESWEKYNRLIAERLNGGSGSTPRPTGQNHAPSSYRATLLSTGSCLKPVDTFRIVVYPEDLAEYKSRCRRPANNADSLRKSNKRRALQILH